MDSVAHLGAYVPARLPVTVQHLTADFVGAAQVLLAALLVLVLALLQNAPGGTGLVAAFAVMGTVGLTGQHGRFLPYRGCEVSRRMRKSV